MLDEPLFQRRIHPGLPTRPICPKCSENLRVEPDRNLFLGGAPVLAARPSHRTGHRRDTTAGRDNALPPADSVGGSGCGCGCRGLGGSDLLGAEDFQSSFGFTNGLHSDRRSSERHQALGPHQKDDPPAPHGQALQPQFTVGLAIIFHRDHREIEGTFTLGEIDVVLVEIERPLGIVSGDH